MLRTLTFALVIAVARAAQPTRDMLIECIFDAPYSADQLTLTQQEFATLDARLRESHMIAKNLVKMGYASVATTWGEFKNPTGHMDRMDVDGMLESLTHGKSPARINTATKYMYRHLC